MNTVYHYCSAETFLSVIKYKKLWLGDIRYMNDYMEMKWFMDAFNELLDTELSSEAHKELLENLKNNQALTKPYISCLSESGDILSQWRAYAQDGHGIAIGFNPNKLGVIIDSNVGTNKFIKQSLHLNTVSYWDKEKIKNEILKITKQAPDVIDFFATLDKEFEDLPNSLQSRIVSTCFKLIHLSLHIKNPAFSEEKEVRIIYNHFPKYHKDSNKDNKDYKHFLASKSFRISSGNLTTHYELPILKDAITEIILGPKCNFSSDDIHDYIKANNIHNSVDIKKSTASYR
ncbi:hypothetical protein ERHA55_29470 [Erwinia rhapontici]|uniref:DUF2971 domain-containing protein n=1 Tax=Erwinia rhapontici TaxID=55212 RepID=A0ABM7N1R4_ERWRD|nr:DUF2971 domain-containing protein [Erwinia rhapontici]BCQ35276.1 hypothetical protein ERHA53_26190 [Erwinia rhapontici]BCQ45420.1 hypothetical protein ERHA55_29470 [Erwinia rhapontici]